MSMVYEMTGMSQSLLPITEKLSLDYYSGLRIMSEQRRGKAMY